CERRDNRIVMNWPPATAKRPHGMVVNESEKLNVLAAKIEPLSWLCVAPKPDKTEAAKEGSGAGGRAKMNYGVETLTLDTELLLPLATQMFTPSNAKLVGPLPTAKVLITLPAPGSICD